MNSSLKNPLLKIETQLNKMFVSREREIRGMLVALLSRQHVFLLGPPGTGKSRLIELFTQMVGGRKFSWQLTKFTKMEDLFGPISISNLKKDKMIRVAEGKMQKAEFSYIDEIWKANSAILNALLSITNERILYDGSSKVSTPLISMFCASNELPADESLSAIYDRILLRYYVNDLDTSGLYQVFKNPVPKKVDQIISLEEVKQYQEAVDSVTIDDELLTLYLELKTQIEAQNIKNYARRYIEAIKALKANAVICGRNKVNKQDFDILADVLWRRPEERVTIIDTIIDIACPESMYISEILDAAKEEIRKIPNIKDTKTKAEFITIVSDAKDILVDQKKELEKFNTPEADKALIEMNDLIKSCTRKIIRCSNNEWS